MYSRYVKNLGVSSREAAFANRELLPFFPELEGVPLNGRNHVDNICLKLEERQTVIGPDISELTIRLNEKMPIRYIYQDPNYFTYERIGIILKIVNASMSYHKNQLMTKEDLIRYIANPGNDLYFNSRYFVKRPRRELLSEGMISELNITGDTSVGRQLEISSRLVEKKSTALITGAAAKPDTVAKFNRTRINRIIDAYLTENFKEVEKNLFFSLKGVKSIDPNLAKILTDRFEATEMLRNINSKLRESADYEPSLLQPLIDLFKEIKTREFPE